MRLCVNGSTNICWDPKKKRISFCQFNIYCLSFGNKKVSKPLEDIKAITHDARGNSTAKKETTSKTYSLTHLIFLQPQFEA